jgi:hypothetical protein
MPHSASHSPGRAHGRADSGTDNDVRQPERDAANRGESIGGSDPTATPQSVARQPHGTTLC